MTCKRTDLTPEGEEFATLKETRKMTESTDHRPTEPIAEPRLDVLVRIIREETEALHTTLPDALTRQWSASPVPRPREDTPQRTSGDRPADPTADAVLDARRLAVRDTVVRSERILRETAIRLRAVRLATERAVVRFDGEDA